jgi:ubiquinone/menaquinone biosynthesis C-methylase UbiE
MLPRVLEPEVMDTPEEAREYDAMDHSTVNARFVTDFLAAHGRCRGGAILDVGTGPARIAIALCRSDPSARLVATDLSAAMLELARRNVAAAGMAARIECVRGDAKGLPWPAGRFEAVISNSIVHHIPDPAPALAEMVRQVSPGGTLFVRDLARPATADEADGLVAAYAGVESESARSLFAASLHAALTLTEVRAIAGALGLPAEGIIMTSDRHWTWTWHREGHAHDEGDHLGSGT